MNYLSLDDLAAAAPAAQPLPKSLTKKQRSTLIDTAVLVEEIEKTLGHRPVMGVQGTSHADAPDGTKATARQRRGRHLVVCANSRGEATIILNSHSVRRRAWIGIGYYHHGLVLVAAAMPMPRWRGAGPAIDEIERWRPMVKDMWKAVSQQEMTPRKSEYIANRACLAYLPGHKPVAPSALQIHNGAGTVNKALFVVLKQITEGNLPAAEEGRRKVKPIKGPDALMHAGTALWAIGAELQGKFAMALPFYRKT
jgi:hypothetical protein